MSDSGRITFHFQDTPFRLRQRHAVRAWLLAIAQEHGQTLRELNYLFCSDNHMLEVNGRHLNHHYCTDILTFPMPSANGVSGDILISIDRVRDNARHHEQRPTDELHRVMAHGLLHLLGLDDTTPELQRAMRNAEDHCLSSRHF